jgi:hypothetical protein
VAYDGIFASDVGLCAPIHWGYLGRCFSPKLSALDDDRGAMRGQRPRKPGSWLVLVSLAVAAAGCAMGARVEHMVPTDIGVPVASANSPYRGAIALGEVSGGEDPPPAHHTKSTVGDKELAEAVRASLRDYGYLATGQSAPYRLDVALIELRRPRSGFTMVGTSFIRYKLVRIDGGGVAFDEVIKVSATRTLDDEPIGVARSRMVLEAIVRGNIARFLRSLHANGPDGKTTR